MCVCRFVCMCVCVCTNVSMAHGFASVICMDASDVCECVCVCMCWRMDALVYGACVGGWMYVL